MRYRLLAIALAIGLLAALGAGVALADKPIKVDEHGNETAWEASSLDCTKIKDGILTTSDGEVIMPGYDEFGYNYQAHMFNGRYCDYDRVSGGAYCDVNLVMKWNDAWLSNVDCDPKDGLLDRHYGFDSYKGSGAWTTNHMWGEYEVGGKVCKWTYFVKIVAVPADAALTDGVWYAADGTEIGPVEWGDFAIVQAVYNDPCGGVCGIEYLSPHHPGLGGW